MIRYTILLAFALLSLATALGPAEKCTKNSQCNEGLSCVGNKGNKKCFKKKGSGMKCGKDPFWVCEDDLVCEDNICKVDVAGECKQPGSVCAGGLSCLGNDGVKKCFMPKGPGMKCGNDPFWVCQADLKCEDRICKTKVRGACNDPRVVCAKGLSCLGKKGKKRCTKKKAIGMLCGKDPYWVCQDKLVCDDGTCKKPVGRNKRCGAKRVCKPRFVCAGPRKETRCVVPGRKGRKCGLHDTCRNSTCIDGKCV